MALKLFSLRWIAASAILFLLPFTPGRAGAQQMLRGHLPAAAKRLQPLRRLETTNVLQLAIGLPLRNQDELTNLLQDLYNPDSPNYRHFLTPDEFAQRFGPTEQDYQAVMAFAKTNGFKVVGTHSNRVVLDVAGAVPDIERAFHLNLHVYRHPTEAREFYAPDAEPQLNLAAPVLHISGLDNLIVPTPLCRKMPAAGVLASTGAVQPAAGSGPSGNYAGKDFRAAYAPGVTNTGVGQSVGLLEFQGYFASDIASYETTYSIPNIPLNNVLLGGLSSITADAGDAECPLDIEMAISMATNLSQVIVYCSVRNGNTDTILSRMATDNLCKQISSSWLVGSDATALQLYQQMAAQGQSFFNASGDSDAASAAAPINEDAPYVTMVGGTTLVTTGAGGSRVSENTWNRGNGTGSTGGISPTYTMPLWQQGISMDANQGSPYMRNVPDVACVAENVWVLYNNGGSGAFGGTSCAAPLWAGYMALVNQQAAAVGRPYIGFINPAVYAIGKSSSYNSDFHDITTGNNTSTTSPSRFNAVTGYDLATGWGTPNGLGLLNAFIGGTGDTLVVTPTNGLTSAGVVGGPFLPASGTFVLANFAGTTNRWTLMNTSTWFTASPASGTLLSSATANVTVTITAAANSLPAGYYTASILFSNQTTSAVQTRQVSLAVANRLTWDSSASGGAPQDGPGIWADQASGIGNTNWWNGSGDLLWSNASPTIATFGASSGAADVVTLGSAITAAGINFTPPGSGNYTIADGGFPLTLNGNIIAQTSATITAPITLGASAIFSATGGQILTVSNLLSGGASNNLVITGPGLVSLTGQNNIGVSAGMAGSVAVNSGTLALNGTSIFGTLGNVSGITVASGATLLLQGTNAISGSSGSGRSLTVNSGGIITNASTGNHVLGPLTLNGGTLAGSGNPTFGSFNLTGDVFVNSSVNLSAQNLTTTLGKSIDVASGQTLTLSGTLIGSVGPTFGGPGTVVLANSNSYTGSTTVNYGTLQLMNSNGLGLASSSVTVGDSAQLQIFTSLISQHPLTLNGVGPSSAGALRISSAANVTWKAAVTLAAPSSVNLDSSTVFAFSNSINASGYSLTLAGGSGSQGIAASPVNLGAGSISKSGAGTWIFAGTNSFTGSLNVDSASTTANDGILRIISPGSAPSGIASVQILDSNSASSTLQLDGTAGNITFAAPFNVNCRNNSVATIENLTGTNILGGPVWLNSGGNVFNILCDAGRLVFNGTNQYIGTLTGGRTYAFSGAGDFLVSGPILNSTNGAPIGLTKAGAGTLTLGGANAYGAGTTVSGGTLLVNGSLTGTLTVAGSTTLGGRGSILSTVVIPSTATLAPGTNAAAIGTLTVSNTATLQAGSITRMKISKTPLTNDVLRVAGASGTVNYGGTLVVTNLAGTLAGGDTFKLFNATSYSGSFVSSNLPPLTAGLLWSTSGLNTGTLQVLALDFGVVAAPVIAATQIGSNAVSTVTITASNGFTGEVDLSISGLPPGASAAFNPPSLTTSGTSTLVITTSNDIVAADYPLVITGTNATFSRTHNAAMTLSVNDFTLAPVSSPQIVNAGYGTNFKVNVGAVNGFSGTVALGVSGLPAGTAYVLSQTNVTGSGAITLTVTTPEWLPTNNYVLTLTGASGSLVHTSQVTLVVQHLPANLVWNSTTSGEWDITTTTNWLDTATLASAFFYQGDAVLFDDTPGVVTNLNLDDGVAVEPSELTVAADTNNFTISGAGKISGVGGLVKQGASTLTLSTTNDFTGNTLISGGTLALAGGGSLDGSVGIQIEAVALLDASGRSDGTLTLNSGQTLSGNGAINGDVVVSSGATLSPGADITGILTISNSLTLAAGSATLIKIKKLGALTLGDAVIGLTNLNYGGILTVTNLGGTSLAPGDAFPIFSSASFSGAFSTMILPPLDNFLYWTNRLAVDGTLAVATGVSLVATNIVFNFDGTNFNLSWPADHTGWRLLVQTGDLSAGISANTNDWTTVSGSQQTNQLAVPVDPTQPAEFYRLVFP